MDDGQQKKLKCKISKSKNIISKGEIKYG